MISKVFITSIFVVRWDMRPLLEPSSIARMMDEAICRTCENVNWQEEIRNFFMVQQLLVCQGLLIIEASRSHSDTAHSVGLLWASADEHWQHTTLTPCPQRDSNTQSRQARDSNPRLRPRAHRNRPEIRNTRKISCPRATSSKKKTITTVQLTRNLTASVD